MTTNTRIQLRLLAVALTGFTFGFMLVMNAVPATAAGMSRLAVESAYRQFIDDYWPRARRAGIDRSTYRRAFSVKTPDWKVIERLHNQPEFKSRPADYIARRVSEKRIAAGVEKGREHARLLRALQAKYGVNRHILLAIWGMESNYGTHMGDHNVIRALSTLAVAGGRYRRYARKQLLAALKIIQAGDISPAQMRGSWAGAMGHTQFIPTTYLGYAVDITKDGRRDIWNSQADALASAANYLKRRGWRRGLPWGWKVSVPAKARRLVGRRHARSIRAWEKLGVRPALARSFYARKARAWLVRLPGAGYYLVTRNFRALLAYNNAKTYAVAVGLLADAIARAASRPPANLPVARARKADISPREKALLRELAAQAAASTATVK